MNVKDLFQKAIEWLRRRVTALKREEGRVKREKVENTRGVYDNENLIKVKGERLEGSKARISKVERRHHNDDDKSFNSHLSTFNSKLTIPEIEALLREKYELRYNVLTEQSEYRMKGSDAPFAAVTQRVYKTWMADLQADGYNVWWAEGVRIPSVRELAVELQVNPNTVMRSYDLLQRDGLITSQRGIGYFVAEGAVQRARELCRKEFLESQLPPLFERMTTMGITAEEMTKLFETYKKRNNAKV